MTQWLVMVDSPILKRQMPFADEQAARLQANQTWRLLRARSGGRITLYRDAEIVQHIDVERGA